VLLPRLNLLKQVPIVAGAFERNPRGRRRFSPAALVLLFFVLSCFRDPLSSFVVLILVGVDSRSSAAFANGERCVFRRML
jgi:hypothetical protein